MARPHFRGHVTKFSKKELKKIADDVSVSDSQIELDFA
jgi:hypothetical protein